MPSLLATVNACKAKIEHACLQHVIVIRIPSVLDGARDVRCQHNRDVGREHGLEAIKARVNPSIWIEIYDAVEICVIQEPSEHERLDCRVELHYVVPHGHVVEVSHPDSVALDNLKDLRARIERAVYRVDEAQIERVLRVYRRNRL